jgi:hypothetical protein
MSDERVEGRMAWQYWHSEAGVLDRERILVPRMREVLRDLYLRYLLGPCDNAEEAQANALVALHLHQLPDSDLRFRLLASFADLDVLRVVADYVEFNAEFAFVTFLPTGPFFEMHGLPTKANVDKLVTLLLLEAVAFDAAYPEERLTPDERERILPPRMPDGYFSVSHEQRAELLEKIRAFPTERGDAVDLVTLLGSDPELITVVLNMLVEQRENAKHFLRGGSEPPSHSVDQAD